MTIGIWKNLISEVFQAGWHRVKNFVCGAAFTLSGADGGTSSGAEYWSAAKEVRFGPVVVCGLGHIGGVVGSDAGGVRRVGGHAAFGIKRAGLVEEGAL